MGKPRFARFWAENYGLDEEGQWLMLPLHGTRWLTLEDGEDLDVVPDKGRLRLEEIKYQERVRKARGYARTFKVYGRRRGTAYLRAKDARGRDQALLEISVKGRKRVTVAIHLVRLRNRALSQLKPKQLPRIVEYANDIIEKQANVHVDARSTSGWLDVDLEGLEPLVVINPSKRRVLRSTTGDYASGQLAREAAWNELKKKGDRKADANVFVVENLYKINEHETDYKGGTTDGEDIVVADRRNGPDGPRRNARSHGRVLAHEICHFLGYDWHRPRLSDHIMAGSGTFLGRGVADVINP